MTAAIGSRSRYVESTDPDDATGILRVESCRWTVDGPHRLHEFRFVAEATAADHGIIHQDFLEHRVGGELVDRFGWGHGTVEAYKSSQSWSEQAGGWWVDLVSAHIFRADLPCCGGRFIATKEHAGYGTLVIGHCDRCGQRWDVGDGYHFSPRP